MVPQPLLTLGKDTRAAKGEVQSAKQGSLWDAFRDVGDVECLSFFWGFF